MSTQSFNNHSLKKIQKTIEEGPQPLYELFNNNAVGKILATGSLIQQGPPTMKRHGWPSQSKSDSYKGSVSEAVESIPVLCFLSIS